jgi:hypothetical protein
VLTLRSVWAIVASALRQGVTMLKETGMAAGTLVVAHGRAGLADH